MRRFSSNANSRIIFRQGSVNKDYSVHLGGLFGQFVGAPPLISTIVDKNSGKRTYGSGFATKALPCFNEFYEL